MIIDDEFLGKVVDFINESEGDVINNLPSFSEDIDISKLKGMYKDAFDLSNKYVKNIYYLQLVLVALSNKEFCSEFDENEWRDKFFEVIGALWHYEYFAAISFDSERGYLTGFSVDSPLLINSYNGTIGAGPDGYYPESSLLDKLIDIFR